MYCTYCADMVEAERDSIALLSKHFKARKDIGSESFEGSTKTMIGVLASMLATRSLVGPELDVAEPDVATPDSDVSEGGAVDARREDAAPAPDVGVKLKVNKDIAIASFIDTLGPRDGLRVTSLGLFGRFLDYVSAQDMWKVQPVDHARFSKAVVHNYAATSEVVRQGADTQRFLVFPGGSVPALEHDRLGKLLKLRDGDDGGGSFRSAGPAVLRGDAQEDAMAEGNLLYQFLVAGPDDNSSLHTRHFVRQIPGAVTEWPALKSAFDAYVRYKHPGRTWTLSTKEVSAFHKLGYEVLQDNMCCACGQRALFGCCPNYSKANRSKRWRVHHMELVREERLEPQPQGEDPLGD